jgi:hypothetical protein
VEPALPEIWKPAVSAKPTNATNFVAMNKEAHISPTRSRALLAVMLAGSLVANVAAQAFGLSLYVSAAFGLIAIASGVALFSHYRKNREDQRT